MHEGSHGILDGLAERLEKGTGQQGVWRQRNRKFLFPGLLLILLVASAVPGVDAWLGFTLALLPLVLGGVYMVFSTVKAVLETGKITAGVLVLLALVGTTYVGEYLAGAVVAFMMIAGEFLEEVTLERTRQAVKEIMKLAPDTARRKVGESLESVPVAQVQPGDLVVVIPGERIPVDGKIIKGQSAINEASLTGESLPVDKTVGDKVFVGTINENGVLEVLTEKTGGATALGRIIAIIREAQENKGAVQRTADRFAVYFTPAILAICALVWLLTQDLYRVMSVLVIACPCALVLATPTAVVASVGNAARRGGIIKGGVTLEAAGRVTAVCLDKTGTLTEGKLQVSMVESFADKTEQEIMQLAATAEKYSQHPIGRAIVKHAQTNVVDTIAESEEFIMLYGRGVQVTYQGQLLEVSNSKALVDCVETGGPDAERFVDEQERLGRTALLVILDGRVLGGLAVADTLRKDAKTMVEGLKRAGIEKVIMLTGDNVQTAAAMAAAAGIVDYRASLLPEDKLAIIKQLQAQGEVVAMVGDGVNDAPALILADVGIAMGVMGTDVAIESADIALMSENLLLIPDLLGLSRKALHLIQQNIWVFAVGVNVVGIALAGSGWLSPIAGAIVHNVSSLLVVGNSSRLLTYHYHEEP